MKRCPECGRDHTDGALKCPHCGASIDETSSATAVLPAAGTPSSSHSTDSADGARFAAGTMLAGRYRIVTLLGRGGMGEVYKAEDLTLKQIVALKFLPDVLAHDGAALARFQSEVRITRQISHPNVCRVYDIGEADGRHFLSMEFIDGEDLAHLLRRIGRLPGDKATEIARHICAGLAAAHDTGVLHRDLKPANIMIDGRGKARVTDFGVSVIAKEVIGAEVASGTPAYMAPEQLTGKEVTHKSDIYSLGLVLYELFTGKRVYDSDNILELVQLHEKSSPTNPSSHVQNIDPLVERVILRCLEKEPKKRPATAIQVAAALPGGDPLAAALAAGETPSPEMVAASGEKTGLRPVVAVVMFAAIIVGIITFAAIEKKVDWRVLMLGQNSPETLKHKSQEIIQHLGYSDPPGDSAFGYRSEDSFVSWLVDNAPAGERWNRFFSAQPQPAYFWYRQSPRDLESVDHTDFGWVTESDPPYTGDSGHITLNLDPAGRLIWFVAVPPQVDAPGAGPTSAPDWSPLFAAAGLDPASFTPTESTWTSMTVCDTRAAWTGFSPGQPDIPIRIEAAAYRGKPVHFAVVAPWLVPRLAQSPTYTTGQNISFAIVVIVLVSVIVLAIFFARHNLRRGRGDRGGAARLSIFIFAITMSAWVFGADHSPTSNEVIRLFDIALSQSLLLAGLMWLGYISLEPYVRRRWPQTIISWSRLLSGGIRDPLVGKDVLVGALAGFGFNLINPVLRNLVRLYSGATPVTGSDLDSWISARRLIAGAFLIPFNTAIGLSLLMFFVLFLFRALTRREWIATILFVVIFTIPSIIGQTDPILADIPMASVFYLLTAILLLRRGLLTMTTAILVGTLITAVPLTIDFSAWYSGYMLTTVIACLALAGWAFHISLGGQKLFSESLLED